ncbi:unnamed protein product, partial [Ectocarpus fasciculatus]
SRSVRGDDAAVVGGVGTGSDLGSAGSPQFGSSRSGSGLLGGGIWSAGTFHPQDLALSPQQAPSSDHNEDGVGGPGDRFTPEHRLFGSASWRAPLGSSGGGGGGR